MMPVTRTIEVTEYTYEDLSDTAKEKALSDYCANGLDYDWWDSVYDDFMSICEIIGIDISGTKSRPAIWFSGFWSQGGGACFEGSYYYRKGATKKIAEYAPNDKELNRIVSTMQAIQRKYFYQLTASIVHRGHYHHSGTMQVIVEHAEYPYRDIGDAEEELTQCLRDLADWLYSKLESEYEYLTSEESFRESCEANEWRFDEEGRLV